MARALFRVPDLHCEGCARAIREGLKGAPGVAAIDIDLDARHVGVQYDRSAATPDAIRDRLAEAGFEATAISEPREETVEGAAPERPAGETASDEERGEHRGLWYALLAVGVGLLALAGYAGYELYPRFDLPAVEGAGLFLLAAGAGIASFFSPCAFPLLVTLLARETAGPEAAVRRPRTAFRRGLGFATALSLGAGLFLLLAGIVVALGGGALFAGVVFLSPEGMILRAVLGGFLILLGLIQLGLLPVPLHAVESLAKPLLRAQARERRRRVTFGFALFGFGYLLAGFG